MAAINPAGDLFHSWAEVMLAPEGRPGDTLPLNGSGAYVAGGKPADRDRLQTALSIADPPPVSAGKFDCLGP